MSFFTHLECSVPCGAPLLDPRGRHHLCACGAPLLARYDLDRARAWSRDTLASRPPTMWRYRELLPMFDGEEPVTLGEGFTPLIHAPPARRPPGPDAPVHQGRIAQPDQLVQGARTVGGDHPRARARRDDDRAAVGGQCRQRRGRLRGAGPASTPRSSCRATSNRRSSASARCTAPTSRWSTA